MKGYCRWVLRSDVFLLGLFPPLTDRTWNDKGDELHGGAQGWIFRPGLFMRRALLIWELSVVPGVPG